MKIGIIVHSKTGNTNSVAQELQEKLLKTGKSVSIERVVPIDEEQGDAKKIQLKTAPDISGYDAIIFGGPVWAFSASPVLSVYLSSIASLKNKKVAIMVTQFFPFPMMGGNRAISQIKKICESKGATVCGTGIVNWSGMHREKKIKEVAEKLSGLF